MRRALQLAVFSTALLASARAQSFGSVSILDASVTASPGHPVEVSNGRVVLTGSPAIVARDHSAPIPLARGGGVLLCRTSSLHIAGTAGTLAIGLDRGAMEIHTQATASDSILTPDLRITVSAGGALDLRMRVSPNGDTCVENRGRKAPQLQLADAFGQASYLLKAGQHVLFEHGSLRQVVDRETTPCGCPPDDPHRVPLNQAQLNGTTTVTPAQAAAANPFPAAQSEGLAPAPPLPADAPGETHTQVSTTFAIDPTAPPPSAPPPAEPPPAAQEPAASHNPFSAIGRFFKRLFVR